MVKKIYKCPHCDGVIEPAKMMAQQSVKMRDTSSEAMRKLVAKRWAK